SKVGLQQVGFDGRLGLLIHSNIFVEPNVKDETRAGERADDLNLGKMRSGAIGMRTKVNSRALSLSAGQANSFVCLIEIQAKNVFFRVFASAIGEIFVFSDDFKTAFLQHSYRPDVVRCCPGENRRIYNKVEHPIERLSR